MKEPLSKELLEEATREAKSLAKAEELDYDVQTTANPQEIGFYHSIYFYAYTKAVSETETKQALPIVPSKEIGYPFTPMPLP